jgi:hypothetical protein
MGVQSKAKLKRRSDRKVKEALEKSGVADRARAAYLGLKREDVQADIHRRYESSAPWVERPGLIQVAVDALNSFGYDLNGLEVKVRTYPGRYVVVNGQLEQEPHRAEFIADISAEALAAAESETGAKYFGPIGKYATAQSN